MAALSASHTHEAVREKEAILVEQPLDKGLGGVRDVCPSFAAERRLLRQNGMPAKQSFSINEALKT